ncbi:GmrSD restriction endonuclease domain-containing protein [Streptomyces sp. RKAG337]|uniref:GmrSD restriction endonuclease domain-containing protein n=1 Tax=Streptomyces sp. RKAG337 TaxID=2893404 RepID=UPI002033C397|nr:DUF262 domain-containing protein [Streptomyces sp. RKAG337]MCM2429336.1 DUF262 domain-containing protein [Streptomyces sp. RKAG337]
MHAEEVTFSKLVAGEKQFQVPLYQRTYSWTDKELKQLWDDVTELVGQAMAEVRTPSHFLGSVVLAPGQMSAGGVSRWLVVDGQQRLTTLMVAFTALRDHIRETGGRDIAMLAEKIHEQYLVNKFLDGNDHYRLLPTQADRGAFIACVAGSPRAGGGDNIGHAYRFFRGVLARGQEEGGDTWARVVVTVLGGLLSIVEITAEPGDNVYRIFKSINNTGVQLQQSDLLRNHLFMLLPRQGEQVYQELWLPMQQSLGPKNLELLFWLDLVLRGVSKPKVSEIYEAQQQRLKPVEGDEDALRAEIADLVRLSERLLRVLRPEREQHPALREVLSRLADWGNQTYYPVALQVLDLVDAGRLDAEAAVESLTYVESFLVRRLICQISPSSLNRIFVEAPKELEKSHLPVPEAIRHYLSGRRRYWPTDAELSTAVRTKPFYWAGKSHQRHYVLRRLEESYDSAEPVDFAKAALTVEHVLPQHPAEEWFELLAKETEVGQTPQDLRDLLVHTLGNLTLTGENSKLSNHPFQRKQQILDGSALRMNREIAGASGWGKAEILVRADALSERAVQLWPGPEDGAPGADDEWPGWAELRAALLAMPAGTWTTYGAIAELIGSHPVAVGTFLAAKGVHGDYRVLNADGRVSAAYEPADRSPRELLEAEGVGFDEAGRAHRSSRLVAEELAELLGKELRAHDDVTTPSPAADTTDRATRFGELLSTNQAPATHESLRSVLRFWQQQDPACHLDYGRGAETSCFPLLDVGTSPRSRTLRPLGLYPVTGVAEVPFGHLKERAPFDDAALRRELLLRFNRIDGVDLAEAKLELYPTFPLDVFASHPDEICAVLEWFVHTTALHAGERDAG